MMAGFGAIVQKSWLSSAQSCLILSQRQKLAPGWQSVEGGPGFYPYYCKGGEGGGGGYHGLVVLWFLWCLTHLSTMSEDMWVRAR